MIEIVRRTQRNVKRWWSGEMALRWTAAGMLEAERQFRKIIGYRDLATLVIAIERDHDRRRHATPLHPDPGGRYRRQRCNHHTGTAATKIHGDRDILLPSLRQNLGTDMNLYYAVPTSGRGIFYRAPPFRRRGRNPSKRRFDPQRAA